MQIWYGREFQRSTQLKVAKPHGRTRISEYGRSGDVQKIREIWKCKIVERWESKKQNLKINVIFYRKPVKLFKSRSNTPKMFW